MGIETMMNRFINSEKQTVRNRIMSTEKQKY